MNNFSVSRYLCLSALIALLTGCAAANAPTAPAVSSDEVAQLRTRLEQTDARLQRLQDSLVMLEVRILDQQRLVEKLRHQGGAPSADTASMAKKTPAELYLAAFGDYTSGRYHQAAEGFSAFLRYYPSNDYAGKARYLLGESLLAQGNYTQAASAFSQTVREYPQLEQAPEALFKLAAAQHALNQPEQAAATLQQLIEQYPQSAAAGRAAAAEQSE